MGIGNFFKSLFDGNSNGDQLAEPVEYKGFTIEPAPINEDGKFRTAGYISGELNGETKRIQFIRADQCNNRDEAIDLAVFKAQQIIDQRGEKLLLETQL